MRHALLYIGLLIGAVGCEAGVTRKPITREAKALDSITMTTLTWKPSGSHVMMASFTWKNESSIAVKDLEVRCRHFAPSGTEVSAGRHIIYEILPAHATQTFADVNMGFIHAQAQKVRCWIESLVAQ